MAAMKEEGRKVLTAALDKRRRDDSLEQAVGREVRRAGLSYPDYLEIVDAVRDHARKHKLDAWESAEALLKEQQEH
jgi:hypothetical protein